MSTRPLTWGGLELPIRPDTVLPALEEARYPRPLRACDLPAIMGVDDWFDAYRFALVQFVADWNHSKDPALLVADPPLYEGTDWRLLPTVAAVVHALVDRRGLSVPEWVWGHKAPRDWVVFCDRPGSVFWNRDLEKAPATCAHHRVFSIRACWTRGLRTGGYPGTKPLQPVPFHPPG